MRGTTLPPAAFEALEGAGVAYIAVPTRHGPHLTPVVHALDGGRLWVTTARSSVKARAWRANGEVAGMVRHGETAVAFRGRVRMYDALDPLTWPAAAVAGPRLLRAAARFSLKNARFFAGYAVDARRVPMAWTPMGRVLARIDLEAGHVVADGKIISGWGAWEGGVEFRRSFSPPPPRPGTEPRPPGLPGRVLGEAGEGVLGLLAGGLLTVLPVSWRHEASEGAYQAVLHRDLLALSGARRDAPAALTVDRSSRWRAADMVGMLIQGRAALYAPPEATRGRRALLARVGQDERSALVRLVPERLVWWEGWSSATVTARGERGTG